MIALIDLNNIRRILMTAIYKTVYPFLQDSYSDIELEMYFTPNIIEIDYVKANTKNKASRLNMLIMMKCFQKFGYFPTFKTIPNEIITYISKCIRIKFSSKNKYKTNPRSRVRHMMLIREFLNIKPFDSKSQKYIEEIIYKHAYKKDEIIDLINISIEELIKERVELPGYTTLSKICDSMRIRVYDDLYNEVFEKMKKEEIEFIDNLLEVENNYSVWNTIKQDSKNPTVNNMKEIIEKLDLIGNQKKYIEILSHIPDIKIKKFYAEAMTMDAAAIKKVKNNKMYTLAFSLLNGQYSKTIDDLTEMLIKVVKKIHTSSKLKLDNHRLMRVKTTDSLIEKLKDIIIAFQAKGDNEDKYKAINKVLESNDNELLDQCNIHLEYAGNNYLPFLWDFFKGKRPTLFKLIEILEIKPTTLNNPLINSIEFLKSNRKLKKDWIEIDESLNLDFSWINSIWWKLITGYPKQNRPPQRINRRYFEVCVFTEIVWNLKSGDIFINGSDDYSDYRDQLVSWEEYESLVNQYSEEVELPNNADDFIDHVQGWLRERIDTTDKNFPKNEHLRIENGEPILSKPEKKKLPSNLKSIESLIKEKLEPTNILDILTDSEHWSKWSDNFTSVSGFDTKISDFKKRVLSTIFCYGCNLGASQTSRSLNSITRKQIQRIDKKYATIENIDKANADIINTYSMFYLPKLWGLGKTLAADGTKWDLYAKNLLSEYHIRYGGYGGIGYYHISDNYIAFFSHFIPCGVWEAVHILDAFYENKSDMKPDTVFSDTQGQNAPVFGLAYLLGIDLMPRIRNWKDYKFFKASKEDKYSNIDELFSDTIDWEIIRKFYPDMMRIVVSIKEGKIKSSTILKKLSNYNKNNNLYKAFRELGRAIRTGFLMKYINDPELRSTIQASTNKVESFNGFAKWISFGEKGIIQRNDREMQKKIIKYNQLIANCIILYNANLLTKIIDELISEGHTINKEIIQFLSPYITSHMYMLN